MLVVTLVQIAVLASTISLPPPTVPQDVDIARHETRVAAQLAPLPAPEPVVGPESWPAIARAVAWCESRLVANAKNPVSSASGYFQFIDGTWESTTGLPAPARAYPADVQLAAFLKLWDDGRGASHWAPSRACWG